jgi:hypothetical protein
MTFCCSARPDFSLPFQGPANPNLPQENSGVRTQNPEPRTQNPEPRTQNPEQREATREATIRDTKASPEPEPPIIANFGARDLRTLFTGTPHTPLTPLAPLHKQLLSTYRPVLCIQKHYLFSPYISTCPTTSSTKNGSLRRPDRSLPWLDPFLWH